MASNIQDYVIHYKDIWTGFSNSKKVLLITGSLALLYCTAKMMYTKRNEIIPRILMHMPENIRYSMLKQSVGSGMVINANIFPFAAWMIYRINKDKIDEIQRLLPSALTIMKHKIYATDKTEDYYLCYNIYMSEFNALQSIRLEINVIAKNVENKGSWVVIDYYTNGMRFDPCAPFTAPNCKKKYFDIQTLNDQNKRQISAGIYLDNVEKKHDLFDFKVIVDLNDKPLVVDKNWITANDVMYMGGEDTQKIDASGYACYAEFDHKEHENYLKAQVQYGINNLFTGIRGELVSCFVIPNRQLYKIII